MIPLLIASASRQKRVSCAEPACPRLTWSETSEHIRPRSVLTERARREACRLVGEDGLDVAAVATTLAVGWGTVMHAVHEYGQPLVDDPVRLAGVQSVAAPATASASFPSVMSRRVLDSRSSACRRGPSSLIDRRTN